MNGSIQDAPDANAFAVATHGISKRYGRTTALDGADLRVPEGAVYLLLGLNGAGKSTLLRVLMNLVRPDSGTAEVFGMDTGRRGPEVRARIGYLPDGRDSAFPRMTCGRLLQHLAAFYPGWDAAYAGEMSSAFDLQPDRKVGTLSKGEARRLHLVLALAHRPPILLLDEPTDGLDPVVRRTTLAILAEHIADTPTTVVLSTHQVHEVESLADHVGILKNGRLAAQMSRDDLRRTVRRYLLDAPDGWQPPPDLPMRGLRRSSAGRELQWTLVGDEREVVERLTLAGAHVREAKALTLEDAAHAYLSEEITG